MVDIKKQSLEILQQLTLQEKILLCTGKDFWHINAIKRLNLPEIMLTDGPHGVRKQVGDSDHLGLNNSVPSTCFPTASASACSFDTDLLQKMGIALGEECRSQGVSVLLGPGVNIKRSPLCGRNFEYFSEDPYLAGKLGAAFVKGVQATGVGTSLKHFAANSQEKARMTTDSVIDERALHEIYLRAFETVVKEANPWTVMSAYNLLNGTYCSENKYLLTDILRQKWGYDGLVVSDWGAVSDSVQSFKNGMDLQMPGPSTATQNKLANALKSGELTEQQLNITVQRIVELILKAVQAKKVEFTCDMNKHLDLACQIATESAVLLKNDGILPADKSQSIAVIGAFAKKPRYQGAGSSKINAIIVDTAYQEFIEAGCNIVYAPGYNLTDKDPDEELINQAVKKAIGADIVFLFAGLPDSYESEGFDRTGMDMPKAHVELIKKVCGVNSHVVVILQAGSPISMQWSDLPQAIIMTYLSGCMGGKAIVDLLLGNANPCGKLAETFPICNKDTPCAKTYPAQNDMAVYNESIFVGYRYYDAAQKQVKYPFGYGLSYTNFEYSNLKLSKTKLQNDDKLEIEFKIKNTGKYAGKEIAQLYIAAQNPVIFKPVRELKAFKKLMLKPGETAKVSFVLTLQDFSHYDTANNMFLAESGKYKIEIGASSRNICLEAKLQVTGDATLQNYREEANDYYNLAAIEGMPSINQFEALLGKKLQQTQKPIKKPFKPNNKLQDIKNTLVGKIIVKQVDKQMQQMCGQDETMRKMMTEMAMDMPLRQFMMLGYNDVQFDGLLNILNGKPFKGITQFIKKQ